MRESGILLHITSLPSPYGIGTMGKEAFQFIDFLKASGQKIWQILPSNPVSKEEFYSPYKSYSAFAGNPLWIDLDLLVEWNYLDAITEYGYNADEDQRYVDFDQVSQTREKIFIQAFQNSKKLCQQEQKLFYIQEKYWLEEYAHFMALKEKNHYLPCNQWTILFLDQSDEDIISFHIFLQYLFYKQWANLKAYANKNEIKILGDMPIYISSDSADFFFKKTLFLTDNSGNPKLVAGVPPDSFSSHGQVWGNPLYNWDAMKKDNYSWWKKRFTHQKSMYDLLRIDHFRGFESFYAIEYDAKDGKNGKWINGPGIDFFDSLRDVLSHLPIIAEDLGVITKEVRSLLQQTGFPGMGVLAFAFNGLADNTHLPHNLHQNMVVYTGTHDNQTIAQWLLEEPKEAVAHAIRYLRLDSYSKYTEGFIRAALGSVANRCIIPIQDYLDFGSWARMNTPSTVEKNWTFRILSSEISLDLAKQIRELTEFYGR